MGDIKHNIVGWLLGEGTEDMPEYCYIPLRGKESVEMPEKPIKEVIMANPSLSIEDIKEELIKYANEICTSDPIKYWNWTELIERVGQAQLRKLYQWGSETCTEHYDKILKRGGQLRRCCYMCWQTLKEA